MQETAAAGLGLADVIAIAVAGAASVVFRVTGRWHCEYASANHGGLTPPALGCTCVCASQKSPFHRQRFVHPSRSGGRQPAVDPANVSVMATPHTFGGRLSRGKGAAGVSPPWCVETHLQGRYRKHAGDRPWCAREHHCSRGRVTTGGLRPPLLYLAARAFVGKIATSAVHERNCARSGGREPAVDLGSASVMATPHTRSATDSRAAKERRASARRGVRKRICKGDTANVRETVADALANVSAVTVTQPRGAYAPRSWLYMRSCIAKVAISPAHVRACKQERRVSARRGVRKRICNGDTANVRETVVGLGNVNAIAVAGGASVVFRVTGR
jgi:hypothetical protein